MKKVLYVSIYRRLNGDGEKSLKSTLNKFKEEFNLYLVSTKDVKIADGIEYSDDDMDCRECIGLFENRIGSQKIIRAFPVDADGNKLPGNWMFGGDFIFSNDARFPHDYPIKLMDRKEE